METITLTITRDEESDWLIARWDDPAGGGIVTEGQTVAELQAMIADAVDGYFGAKGVAKPSSVRLHFVEDPVMALE